MRARQCALAGRPGDRVRDHRLPRQRIPGGPAPVPDLRSGLHPATTSRWARWSRSRSSWRTSDRRRGPNVYEAPAWRGGRRRPDASWWPRPDRSGDLVLPASSRRRIWDIGCGLGIAVEHLVRQHGLAAVGIDRSDVLLDAARNRAAAVPIIRASADALPCPSRSLDAVIAECSWSSASAGDGERADGGASAGDGERADGGASAGDGKGRRRRVGRRRQPAATVERPLNARPRPGPDDRRPHPGGVPPRSAPGRLADPQRHLRTHRAARWPGPARGGMLAHDPDRGRDPGRGRDAGLPHRAVGGPLGGPPGVRRPG